MDQSKGQLCRVEPNGNQDISRKDRCSDHSRGMLFILVLLLSDKQMPLVMTQ